MSMALDSPMEALAINYLTHVWTWIAFLTAAVSFWKIKSSIHSPSSLHHHRSLRLPSPSPSPSPSPPQPRQPSAEPEPDPDQQELPSKTKRTPSFTSTTFCSLENRRSGKFRVYYGQDDMNTKDDGNIATGRSERRMTGSIWHNPEEEERLMSCNCNFEEDGWDAILKLKTAETGWYRYQDLTVLDGNVVRLWNQFNHCILLDY